MIKSARPAFAGFVLILFSLLPGACQNSHSGNSAKRQAEAETFAAVSLRGAGNGSGFVAAAGVSYDAIRLYNSDPVMFPSLQSAGTDWSDFDGRRDWMLSLNLPAPLPANNWHPLSATYALADFYKNAAGTPKSNAEEYPGYIKNTAESYRMMINEIVYALTH